MTSIATTLSGVISIIQVGQEIYRMIDEFIDSAKAIYNAVKGVLK